MIVSVSGPGEFGRYSAWLRIHYYPMNGGGMGVSLRRCPQITDTLTVNDLEVHSRGKWLPLIPWLEGYAHNHQDTSYTRTDWWWITRGQTFRFLDLPAELRVMVYENIVGRYIWPRSPRRSSNQLYTFHVNSPSRIKTNAIYLPKSGQYWFDPIGDGPPRAFAMPLVSRQVRGEFTKVLWENTYKHFNCLTDFGLVGLGAYKLTLKFCRRISLGLTNAGYFRLVGLRNERRQAGLTLSSDAAIKTITGIETLEHLSFHLQVSYAHTDPSWSTGVSCQKLIVDWFLTAALTSMDRVPNITLSGHVKHSTRRKWEAIFEDEQKGIKHDMTVPMANILSTPVAQL